MTMYFLKRVKLLAAGLIFLTAASALVRAEDRFALAVGAHDALVIFGPKGDRIAEIMPPTIGQAASVAGVSFQVSYGRDMDGRLTAILAPATTSSGALHFNVLGKAIDADQAVVTLTFARNLKSVSIDPGYAGTVEVNSHRLRLHRLSDDAPVPGLYVPGQIPASSAAAAAPAPPVMAQASAPVVPNSAPAPVTTPAPASTNPTSAPSTAQLLPSAPPMLASQMTVGEITSSAAVTTAATPAPTAAPATGTPVAVNGTTKKTVRLFWAEPVTPPDGPAPTCAPDEVRLVEVYGGVTVTLPNGETKTGVNGMVVPAGSNVVTMPNSSTAIFMGGVNSARMMPETDLTVTQTFDGTHRTDRIDLEKGAVFGRVGKREGEVQDFTIHTPEGVSSGDCANLLAFRGSMADIPALRSAMNTGRLINPHRLFAWDPPALGRNLISDVVAPLIGVPSSGSTIFYYAPNQSLDVNQVQSVVIAAKGTDGKEGPNADDPNRVLQGILTTVLPFNQKLNGLLSVINGGTATNKEIAFYKGLISVYFDTQIPAITTNISGLPSGATDAGIRASKLALIRDLEPFNTPAATPF